MCAAQFNHEHLVLPGAAADGHNAPSEVRFLPTDDANNPIAILPPGHADWDGAEEFISGSKALSCFANESDLSAYAGLQCSANVEVLMKPERFHEGNPDFEDEIDDVQVPYVKVKIDDKTTEFPVRQVERTFHQGVLLPAIRNLGAAKIYLTIPNITPLHVRLARARELAEDLQVLPAMVQTIEEGDAFAYDIFFRFRETFPASGYLAILDTGAGTSNANLHKIESDDDGRRHIKCVARAGLPVRHIHLPFLVSLRRLHVVLI